MSGADNKTAKPKGESKKRKRDRQTGRFNEKRVQKPPTKRAKTQLVATEAYDLALVNTVATTNLSIGDDLNLEIIADMVLGRLQRGRFPPIVIRLKEPRCTLNLFDTGKLVLSGANMLEGVVYQAHYFCERLSSLLSRHVMPLNIVIENMVASRALGFCVDLGLLYDDCKAHAGFTPDTIGSVRIFPPDGSPKPVVLLYEKGGMVVTGATDWETLVKTSNMMDWSKYKQGAQYRQLDPSRRRQKTENHGRKGGKKKQEEETKKKKTQQEEGDIENDGMADIEQDVASAFEAADLFSSNSEAAALDLVFRLK